MNRILIVSPCFPPVNSPDHHRIRVSVKYFMEMGWEPVILAVKPEYTQKPVDPFLVFSLPKNLKIHYVKAIPYKWTKKFGLGNLGIRSFLHLLIAGNNLLKSEKFNLIYFSTTVFDTIPLGRIWKKKFKIPFIVDFQDPWRNDFHLSKPKEKRPKKYWFDYWLKKKLEKWTMPYADGIVSVSEGYIYELVKRYPSLKKIPKKVITFGIDENDFQIVKTTQIENIVFQPQINQINIVYMGVVPPGMIPIIELFFEAIIIGLKENKSLFGKLRIYFIGTNYAPSEQSKKIIMPIAEKYGLTDNVIEITKRVSYFEALKIIGDSDLLFLPGTIDKNYTASKLYPYIQSGKFIFAIFNAASNVSGIIDKTNAGICITFNHEEEITTLKEIIYLELKRIIELSNLNPNTNWESFSPFSAKSKAREQIIIFNNVIKNIYESH